MEMLRDMKGDAVLTEPGVVQMCDKTKGNLRMSGS